MGDRLWHCGVMLRGADGGFPGAEPAKLPLALARYDHERFGSNVAVFAKREACYAFTSGLYLAHCLREMVQVSIADWSTLSCPSITCSLPSRKPFYYSPCYWRCVRHCLPVLRFLWGAWSWPMCQWPEGSDVENFLSALTWGEIRTLVGACALSVLTDWAHESRLLLLFLLVHLHESSSPCWSYAEAAVSVEND